MRSHVFARDELASQEHFVALDSLRGLAALLVVLHHMPPWLEWIYGARILRNSYLMVELFFVLSGFVILYSSGHKITSAKKLSTFMALRIGRLYPVHLIFLLLFLGFEFAKAYAASHGINLSMKPFETNDGGAFAEQLFLTHGLGLFGNAMTFNMPSWSISTEIFAYLLFGILILLLPKRAFLFAAVGIVLIAMALLLGFDTDLDQLTYPLRCFAGFFLGCLICVLYRSLSLRAGPSFDWPAIAIIILVAFVSLKDGHSGWDIGMFFLSAFLILSILLTPRSLVKRCLMFPPLVWLGKISYSLYMSHAFVLLLEAMFLKLVLKRPEIVFSGFHVSVLSPVMAYVIYPITVLICLCVAWATYGIIENPGRKLSRRLFMGEGEIKQRPSAKGMGENLMEGMQPRFEQADAV